MGKKILLECPVYTVEAALLAEKSGVDRIELCADIGEGGTTPSIGLFTFLRQRLSIPIMVMIRPRGGDFVYTEEELEVMATDVRQFKYAGASGFVFGILTPQGKVDEVACKQLISQAGELPCTFHRAIDISISLLDALESVIACGFARVLTSGGRNTVEEGLSAIQAMLMQAGSRIIVMPGGGTRVELLDSLYETGHLSEVHSSCKQFRATHSLYRHPVVNLSADPESMERVLTIDPLVVVAYREKIALLTK
ncbi:copper homeostasis protein CutC [Lunatibacter salilacus]|uniref:copper homeostasis protein CutC n=1 Tax=Lunatibacter salilacus TaxID=2483804 RepID=UPI00131E70DF|nr:copper homeostasis protein CutC [Lunatibacter salilacus]